MQRWIIAAGMLTAPIACVSEEQPTNSTSAMAPVENSSTSPVDKPPPATTTGDDSGPEQQPWFEVGWGVTEFNEFQDILPVVIGPQGLSMFSLPLRGAGFFNPSEPSFDNPDMPILHAWVDVEGYALTPEGHFNQVVDYPALFYPALDPPGALEGPAVWLVLPDGVEPEAIAGLNAQLHAELVDANDTRLNASYALIIGEAPEPPPGP